MLAASILDTGKTILKAASKSVDSQHDVDGRKASEAVLWIQSAFAVVEKTENAASPGLADLKVDRITTTAIVKLTMSSMQFYAL